MMTIRNVRKRNTRMTMMSLVIVMMVRMKTNEKEEVGQRRAESRVLPRLN